MNITLGLAGITGDTQEQIKQSLVEYLDKFSIVDDMDKRYDDFYCGFVDYFNKYIKYYPNIKKMKSKSKQPRYVRVVMKGEWK